MFCPIFIAQGRHHWYFVCLNVEENHDIFGEKIKIVCVSVERMSD